MLVHVATGPENPTRAALGLLVARTAAREGHAVVGTGSVADHLAALREAGAEIYLSGMSSKARGIDDAVAAGAELAPPEKLVELAVSSETVFTY